MPKAADRLTIESLEGVWENDLRPLLNKIQRSILESIDEEQTLSPRNVNVWKSNHSDWLNARSDEMDVLDSLIEKYISDCGTLARSLATENAKLSYILQQQYNGKKLSSIDDNDDNDGKSNTSLNSNDSSDHDSDESSRRAEIEIEEERERLRNAVRCKDHIINQKEIELIKKQEYYERQIDELNCALIEAKQQVTQHIAQHIHRKSLESININIHNSNNNNNNNNNTNNNNNDNDSTVQSVKNEVKEYTSTSLQVSEIVPCIMQYDILIINIVLTIVYMCMIKLSVCYIFVVATI